MICSIKIVFISSSIKTNTYWLMPSKFNFNLIIKKILILGPKPTKYYIIFNLMICSIKIVFISCSIKTVFISSSIKTNTYWLMPSKFNFNLIIKKILNIEKKYLDPYFRPKVYILAHQQHWNSLTYILYHGSRYLDSIQTFLKRLYVSSPNA
jgi:hypothetical protein